MAAEKDGIRRVSAVWPAMVKSTSSTGFRSLNPPNTPCVDNVSLKSERSGAPLNGPYGYNGPCCRYNVGSLHPGGLNVLLCDGSVHFISESIEAALGVDCGNEFDRINDPTYVHKYFPGNVELWQRLFNCKDGQPIESF